MAGAGTAVANVKESTGSFFDKIFDLLESTHLPEQISEVDTAGLFSNPWFLVPFIGFVGYMIYKQAFRDLAIFGIILGIWYATGTEYMQTLVVGDELQISKILPVLFGGAAALGVAIYLLFGRSD